MRPRKVVAVVVMTSAASVCLLSGCSPSYQQSAGYGAYSPNPLAVMGATILSQEPQGSAARGIGLGELNAMGISRAGY